MQHLACPLHHPEIQEGWFWHRPSSFTLCFCSCITPPHACIYIRGEGLFGFVFFPVRLTQIQTLCLSTSRWQCLPRQDTRALSSTACHCEQAQNGGWGGGVLSAALKLSNDRIAVGTKWKLDLQSDQPYFHLVKSAVFQLPRSHFSGVILGLFYFCLHPLAAL